jgi:hypothetical protein
MAKKLVPTAVLYDFDGTLAPGNMQERDFFPALAAGRVSFIAPADYREGSTLDELMRSTIDRIAEGE